MQLRVVTDQPWDVKADVLAIPIVGEPAFDGPLGELNQRSGGELAALVAFGELRAKRFTSSLAASGENGAGRLLTVSAGPAGDLDRETILHVGAAAEHRLGGRHASSLAVWITPLAQGFDLETVAELVARGVVEGAFEPKTLYRDHDDVATAPPVLDELILVAPGADAPAVQRAAERGVIIGEGANYAKTLSNRAANEISPEVLADEARTLATKHGLWIDVIEPERAQELGMGMFLAVGRGSDNPPRMIVMRSGGEGQRDTLDRHLAIVGKGVCFDSGGISIKPADRMEEMKMDKIGACTVIAAIATVARIAPGTPLLAVAPAVENMPGPHSTRPGDVVKALNGKWVDITNTDAEGRLILGDAMVYAERLGATHIVDVATLTGAVSRAFGHLITGGFGTPNAWWDDVMTAADKAAERYWRIPLVDEYQSEMESWYGDIINSGSAEGSLVKSGIFLREFRTVPWVHLDIGGSGYFRKTTPWAARGATGVTHSTLVELALAGGEGLTLTPLAAALAIGGALFGVVADRFAVRWPEHDEENPPGRAAGWRTIATAGIGAFAFALLETRLGSAALVAQVVFGLWFACLVVGFAVDLDQRLLPDELTLPIVPLALLLDVTGNNPLVGTEVVAALVIAVIVPAVLFLLSIPFGAGAFGLGDVKLLIGAGLMLGFAHALSGLLAGLIAAGLVLGLLLVTKRIGRRTYVPFGPFLIFGALWSIFVTP